MSPTIAALLGALMGLVVGVLLALQYASRRVPAASVPPAADQDAALSPTQPAGSDTDVLPEEAWEVLRMLRAGTIVVDRSGSVVRASDLAIALGLVRQRYLVYTPLRKLVRDVQQDGVVRQGELDLPRGPLGSDRVLAGVRIAPLSSGLCVVLVEDHSQERRIEQVRRDFVVNVSHELKTPVGGLALLAEAVQDAADDPEAIARFAGRMKRETDRLSRLVTEIVDLSRLQATEALREPVLVDMTECAQEAVDHTRLVAQNRLITVSATDAPGQSRIYGNHDLIVTAIRNLVTNAISYSEDHTRVSVVVRRREELVEVSVSDQGSGISADDQGRIFERFYRVDSARSRDTGGTGLGLSIVKHICANHGGDVTVWSQPNQGSTFTIRIPAADDSRPVGSAAPPRLRPPTPDPDAAELPQQPDDSLEHSGDSHDNSGPAPSTAPAER